MFYSREFEKEKRADTEQGIVEASTVCMSVCVTLSSSRVQYRCSVKLWNCFKFQKNKFLDPEPTRLILVET